jgi:hypothetical protein
MLWIIVMACAAVTYVLVKKRRQRKAAGAHS